MYIYYMPCTSLVQRHSAKFECHISSGLNIDGPAEIFIITIKLQVQNLSCVAVVTLSEGQGHISDWQRLDH